MYRLILASLFTLCFCFAQPSFAQAGSGGDDDGGGSPPDHVVQFCNTLVGSALAGSADLERLSNVCADVCVNQGISNLCTTNGDGSVDEEDRKLIFTATIDGIVDIEPSLPPTGKDKLFLDSLRLFDSSGSGSN